MKIKNQGFEPTELKSFSTFITLELLCSNFPETKEKIAKAQTVHFCAY